MRSRGRGGDGRLCTITGYSRSTAVKVKKLVEAQSPQQWSVAQLGAFYTDHRFELHTHAMRILKDAALADEVVQDAFIKVMLAAPELSSDEHAASYLHRTIENLCIDLFRAEGRRPNLVLLDDATSEVESSWQDSGDHSQLLSAAEDAAIIRQALALLSPAERSALVMWEMDGRSTAEIAAELGIKESAVRHTVARARASLRRILAEVIIDEERGLTALDLLSSSYAKVAAAARKSSKAALSLIVLLAAFLGFNSWTGPSTSTTTSQQSSPAHKISPAPTQSEAPTTQSPSTGAASSPIDSVVAQSVTTFGAALHVANSLMTQIQNILAKFDWPGVDADGLPAAFTINNGRAVTATGSLINFDGQGANTSFFTADTAGISLTQNISPTPDGFTASILPSLLINGAWVDLNVTQTIVNSHLQGDGSALVIVTLPISSQAPVLGPSTGLPATGQGMSAAPAFITAKIHLSADGSRVLGEAIQVIDAKTVAQGSAL